MHTRLDLLRRLVDVNGYRSYLEIGVAEGFAFDHLGVADRVGVDPDPATPATHHMGSDEYFATCRRSFDLVFVDGLHTAEQVRRDIEAALEILSPGGTIVVHDCNPAAEHHQFREPVTVEWTGDVWKGWVGLRTDRADLEMFVVDIDWGCGVIRRGHQEPLAEPGDLTWKRFVANRHRWLPLVDVETAAARLASVAL